jgi:pimeloyl-ACP methyl ester carboxylesterase
VKGDTVVVRGGAGGLAARGDDLLHEAALLTRAAEHALALAAESHRLLVDPDLLQSAVLDPAGAARFSSCLLAALDGPTGLSAVASGIELHAQRERWAVRAYRTLEQAQVETFDSLHWVEGEALGLTAPAWLPALGALVAADAMAGRDVTADLDAFLATHPEVVDDLVQRLPGLLTGLEGLVPVGPDVPVRNLSDGARLLGPLFPNGSGQAVLWAGDVPEQAPARDLGALLAQLQRCDGGFAHDSVVPPTDQPLIAVHRLRREDGTLAWVVDLPGTSAWPGPGRSDNPADTAGNLHSVAGHATAYQQAVEQALAQVGVAHTEPVLLVGHSQGGMVAVQTAADLAARGYAVSHVVTAGSPVGSMSVPSRVQVLSFENTVDLVPLLDGKDNPDAANRTTVSFTDQTGSIGGNHSLARYAEAAAAVAHTDDPSVAAWRTSADADFLGQGVTSSTLSVFTVHRS